MASRGKGKGGGIPTNRHRAFKALLRKGVPKRYAAAIAVGGRTKAGRSLMARKSARSWKAKGGRTAVGKGRF